MFNVVAEGFSVIALSFFFFLFFFLFFAFYKPALSLRPAPLLNSSTLKGINGTNHYLVEGFLWLYNTHPDHDYLTKKAKDRLFIIVGLNPPLPLPSEERSV